MDKTPQIAIIGYAGLEEYPVNSKIPQYCYACSASLGKQIGERKWYLITGGESGIMESASMAAKNAGGITIGVMSESKRGKSNNYIDIEVVTNSYETSSTPTLIAMADIVIVCGGGAGTLQEIAVAYRLNKPIILMKKTGGWADRLQDEFLDERKKYPLIRSKSSKECLFLCQKIIQKNVERR